ncbi:MAG: DUF2335 domain-containing protein [Actinomycetota bacterium]|nr:DUF2335 domain-containing protein [Actinomycetota bacterium]
MALEAELSAESYTGPLPHPSILQRFEEVLPGSAERIFQMAEEQAQHRQDLERVVVQGGSRRANLGLWLGFLISVAVLGMSGALIFAGHDVAGATLGSVDIVGLAAVFVVGRLGQQRERVEKARQLRRQGGSG